MPPLEWFRILYERDTVQRQSILFDMQLFRSWIPAFAWMALIFIASTDLMSAQHTSRFIGPFLQWLRPDISPEAVAAVELAVRKTAHVTEYAILAVLLTRAFRVSFEVRPLGLAVRVIAVCACCAALDEFHQTFVASRTASPVDVMIDVCGVMVGLVAYQVLFRRK
nr:VanZ family protein [Chthoniobacterales bacterium]